MVHRKLASMKKFATNKLALGIVSASVMALVGMTGAAGATGMHGNHGNGNGGHSGYGGGTNAEVNLDLDVKGDNNVVNIVINFLFG